jgi:hypothetical protein
VESFAAENVISGGVRKFSCFVFFPAFFSRQCFSLLCLELFGKRGDLVDGKSAFCSVIAATIRPEIR